MSLLPISLRLIPLGMVLAGVCAMPVLASALPPTDAPSAELLLFVARFADADGTTIDFGLLETPVDPTADKNSDNPAATNPSVPTLPMSRDPADSRGDDRASKQQP